MADGEWWADTDAIAKNVRTAQPAAGILYLKTVLLQHANTSMPLAPALPLYDEESVRFSAFSRDRDWWFLTSSRDSRLVHEHVGGAGIICRVVGLIAVHALRGTVLGVGAPTRVFATLMHFVAIDHDIGDEIAASA
jgi:hypothetical protein